MHSIESLEPRRLLAANLTGGALTVSGTAGNDVIELDLRDNGSLKVGINNVETNFTYSQITSITVYGFEGNDVIEFNQRNPIMGALVIAGTGHDTVEGTAGRDTIYGNGGNDHLDGREGADLIFGENGNDVIEGKGGNDSLYGGGGNDYIEGHAGDDLIRGNAGHDDLVGGSGRDRIRGNGGNDDFHFDDRGGSAQIEDESGVDVAANVLTDRTPMN